MEVGGRDVVRPVGIQQARQRLDVLTADTELELSTAVQGDAGNLRALDAVEERAQRAEARRFYVEVARQ